MVAGVDVAVVLQGRLRAGGERTQSVERRQQSEHPVEELPNMTPTRAHPLVEDPEKPAVAPAGRSARSPPVPRLPDLPPVPHG